MVMRLLHNSTERLNWFESTLSLLLQGVTHFRHLNMLLKCVPLSKTYLEEYVLVCFWTLNCIKMYNIICSIKNADHIAIAISVRIITIIHSCQNCAALWWSASLSMALLQKSPLRILLTYLLTLTIANVCFFNNSSRICYAFTQIQY